MSGTQIDFQYYPKLQRVPGFYAEVNADNANTGDQNWVALIIGQVTSAGTAVLNEPIISSGTAQAATLGGSGSMLHLMTRRYKQEDDLGELWLLPIADASGAVAATGTIVITAAATAAGTLSLYVAGLRVQLAVATSMTTAQIATALSAAINAVSGMPVTATVATSTVTLTALNKGAAAGDIDLRWNYLGTAGGEALPTGFAATVTAMSGGATNPDLATALANLGDQQFDIIICPFTDANSISELKNFLALTSGGRWSWDKMLYGVAISAARGTYGTITTLGTGLNAPHVGIIGFYDSPEPAYIWAADLGANVAVSVRADPAQPLQDIALGVLAPPGNSLFPFDERETLLFDGISTFKVARDGTVSTERLISTYQTDANGDADSSWLDLETDFTLMAVIRDLKTYSNSQFRRKKLVADGSRIPVGSNLVTSQTVLASIVARYRTLEAQGLVQMSDVFAKNALAQNAGNGRVALKLPIYLANQLRDIAALINFSKP